jgi:hypothetical protein
VVFLVIGFGLLGILSVRRPPIQGRPEVPWAVAIATVAGALLGLYYLFGLLFVLCEGPGCASPWIASAVALGAGLLEFSLAVGGYWLGAMISRGRLAALGAIPGAIFGVLIVPVVVQTLAMLAG